MTVGGTAVLRRRIARGDEILDTPWEEEGQEKNGPEERRAGVGSSNKGGAEKIIERCIFSPFPRFFPCLGKVEALGREGNWSPLPLSPTSPSLREKRKEKKKKLWHVGCRTRLIRIHLYRRRVTRADSNYYFTNWTVTVSQRAASDGDQMVSFQFGLQKYICGYSGVGWRLGVLADWARG